MKYLVPNPILIRNKTNIEIINEKTLHHLILEDIESFLKELGSSFSFIGSEYKIKIRDRNHHFKKYNKSEYVFSSINMESPNIDKKIDNLILEIKSNIN